MGAAVCLTIDCEFFNRLVAAADDGIIVNASTKNAEWLKSTQATDFH